MARTRESIEFLKQCKKASEKIKRMQKNKPKKLIENLDEMAKSVITRWYASYEPHKYNRKRSLYQAYRIYQDGIDVEIMFDTDFIYEYVHNQDNEIVYQNVFIEGYHGGSRTKGNKGIPRWRAPFPQFTNWSRKTVPQITPSPYETILAESEKILEAYDNEWADDLESKVLQPLVRSLGGLTRK